jgi:hypothetical protein
MHATGGAGIKFLKEDFSAGGMECFAGLEVP